MPNSRASDRIIAEAKKKGGRRSTSINGITPLKPIEEAEISAEPQPVAQSSAKPKPVAQQKFSSGMLRIDSELNNQIRSFCGSKGITRDAFVEASWIVLQMHPALLEEIAETAEERHQQRKAIGNARRARSMEKYKELE